MSWRIIQGDCIEKLRELEAGSVHCVVTSPPYWGLRDYGVEGQLGLERTPEEFVNNLVRVFREVRRVLRNDGVLWVNIGDCFATGAGIVGEHPGGGAQGDRWKGQRPSHSAENAGKQANRVAAMGPMVQPNRMPIAGLKPKDLVGVPWHLAFALQTDGWWLRRDILWSKPNPMPESVNGWRWEQHKVKVESQPKRVDDQTAVQYDRSHSGGVINADRAVWEDCPGCPKCSPNKGLVLRKGSGRCTTAHEYLFHLTKSGDYYYDCESIKEPLASDPKTWGRHSKKDPGLQALEPRPMFGPGRGGRDGTEWGDGASRNRRSVWEIATEPWPASHFAVYPQALVEPCVKATTSEKGCCAECGAPWARVLEPSEEAKARLGSAWHDHVDDLGRGQRGTPPALKGPATITKGWRATCECNAGDPVPCTVLDIFAGSGTTGVVALKLGRNFIGLELKAEYADMARKRISQASVELGTGTVEETELLGAGAQLGLFGRNE